MEDLEDFLEEQEGGDQSDPRLFDIGRLKKAGIRAREQILLWAPKGYEDYTKIERKISESFEGSAQVLSVRVTSTPQMESYTPPRLGFEVSDGTTSAKVAVFGDTRLWKNLKKGEIILVECKVERFAGKLYLKSPKLIPIEHAGRVIARYAGIKGVVSESSVAEKVNLALQHHLKSTISFILGHFPGLRDEKHLLEEAGIKTPLSKTLQKIHAPQSPKDAQDGESEIRRLAAFEIVYRARLMKTRPPNVKSAIDIDGKNVLALLKGVPFTPTQDQKNTLRDIVKDLRDPYPARRLVSGDVGVGKSLPLLVAAMSARDAGATVAFLVPNVLLAHQLYKESTEWFGRKAKILLVSGGVALTKEQLKENPLLIGTTTLINRMKKLKIKPDVLICDEQHKFSREQRESLSEDHTNLIEATATCIPRTMALVTHGGMDVSILKERPVQREVKSYVVEQRHKPLLFQRINEKMQNGEQVAIIYPRVDNDDENAKRNVEAAFKYWEARFPGKCAMIHGKLKDNEKAEAISVMREGQKQLLIASIALEVGVTIPQLKTLVVVEADRYGAATLHQMRGRLARTGGVGYFFMLPSGTANEETLDRLSMVAQNDDGFRLAELDMDQRGCGNLSTGSDDQHGASLTLFRGIKITPQDLVVFEAA